MMENDTSPVTGTEIAAGGSMTITGTGIGTGTATVIGIETETAIETGTAANSVGEDNEITPFQYMRIGRSEDFRRS
jgi:hypothetical protein